ncbi:DUF945 domain-containing protein [Deinococcus deserti]|uniref:DUF945 domain-containing protein n=2 Tax=Deinococcus TaxID=1298 RepID=C1D3S1_DEIDV|nr:Conserved hypothetical protein, precursor [Deinococcus deserti VCD115]
MKKPVKIAAISAALLLGSAGIAAVAGQQTQKDIQAQLSRTQKALNDSGMATVVSGPFQGNAFGGTQTTTITVLPESEDPLVITLNSRVYSGPFPQGKRFGAATVITNVLFEPDLQAQLDKAFGGKKIELNTLVQFGGTSTTTFKVPGGTLTDEGTTVAWQPAGGTVRAAGNQVFTAGEWPGAQVTGEELRMNFGRVQWDLKAAQAADNLGDGMGNITLAELKVSGADGADFALKGLNVRTESRGSATTFDSMVSYGIKALTVGGKDIEDIKLNLTLKNLDRSALVKLNEATRGGKTLSDRTIDGIVSEMLGAKPALVLDRLSVGTGQDEVRLNGLIGMKAPAGTDWTRVSENPELLMGLLHVKVHGEAERAALIDLLSTVAPSPEMAPELINMGEKSGMLIKEGSRIVTDVSLSEHGLMVNGQPLQ